MNPSSNSFVRSTHVSRRTLLRAAGLGGMAWLTPLAHLLGRAQEKEPSHAPAKSVIMLWMAGGPSQLETFDPHPGMKDGTSAIKTSVGGIKISDGLPKVAEVMDELTIIRSMVSKEGDHERASYNMKTGHRPVPALIHPSIGAVICHQLPEAEVDIPRHISILPGQWPARGGYLGAGLDAFKVYDTHGRTGNMIARVKPERQEKRMEALKKIEDSFALGRRADLDKKTTLHNVTINKALEMMDSKRLGAFDVIKATAPHSFKLLDTNKDGKLTRAENPDVFRWGGFTTKEMSDDVITKEEMAVMQRRRKEQAARTLEPFGDSQFGRGCLAAIQLVEAGVRCVEVTLGGWDTHLNNHEGHAKLNAVLDPAFAALIRELLGRELLDQTVVICGGEFGRTPKVNGLGGRDHWPKGFSVALAGGGFRGGHVHGSTDPRGESKEPGDPIKVADIHSTVLHTLGIEYDKEMMTTIGRPMALSKGKVVKTLLKDM